MSFWQLSDGESAVTNASEYEAGGGDFEPFPDGSRLLAEVETISWKTNENGNDEHIGIKWSVIKPEEHANRKVFQSLWVTDDNPYRTGTKIVAKRNRDKRQFAKLDDCCGGKLGQKAAKPTDDGMTLALVGKPCIIELGIMNGDNGPFNWVRNIYSKNAKAVSVPEQAAKPAARKAAPDSDDLDDDIPF